jgi:hypothetical protein
MAWSSYDRWDNCYLFSGVYLMYVSKSIKELLRPYRGKSIEIDAKDVYQPMNPGDGLIRKLVVLGESKDNPQSPSVLGVRLRAAVTNGDGVPRATIEIANTGHAPITIHSDALGFAVIVHGNSFNYWPLCLSDGTSCAAITRAAMNFSGGKYRIGDTVWGWQVKSADRLPGNFTLESGEIRKTSLTLELPAGSYQFIAGYGGGVHSGPCAASNAVSFDVDRGLIRP